MYTKRKKLCLEVHTYNARYKATHNAFLTNNGFIIPQWTNYNLSVIELCNSTLAYKSPNSDYGMLKCGNTVYGRDQRKWTLVGNSQVAAGK